MPVVKIHVHEGAFKDSELATVGTAVQAALEEVLSVPPEDHFRISHGARRKASAPKTRTCKAKSRRA
jgi:hypothetical protein